MENDKLYEHSSGILSENIGAKPLFTDALPQTEKEAFEFIMGSLVLKQNMQACTTKNGAGGFWISLRAGNRCH